MSKLVDLSHTIEDGIVTYKGLPAPIICDYLSREASEKHYEDASFHIGKIEMVANTGTYIDAPFHRYAAGKDIAELSLSSVSSLPGVKVTVPDNVKAVGREFFESLELAGKAVLVETGWSRHWKSDSYYENNPYLTEDAAVLLKERGVALVGIDSLNIDDTSTGKRPVHSILLGAEILIVEHLCNLKSIPKGEFKFYAVPVKVKGFGTFPVRAFAEID
ncbi:cyclase family protein [Aliikangiella coralliicola]|uniref:Cyclase family protein n=1 Tax=Aliikangiella coralliicola TaxID=2592383 RepID=A0A545U7Z0_9GAMM|nr:cyclase family protein [Aliikangiella coralliicola]TQV85578.1 cyclase family protein [Aliikangiella coralliicola]